jgi:uncharacterized membrane protein (DUF373 family)
MELAMPVTERPKAMHGRWRRLSPYRKFEYVIVLILTGLIAVVIASAVWNLALKVVSALMSSDIFDPTDHVVFQGIFGMIFTAIIALEFNRTLLFVAERPNSIVHVRAVILIAILAIVRKLIILDLGTADAPQLFALAVAILSLGGVYWLVRNQDREDALSTLTESPSSVGRAEPRDGGTGPAASAESTKLD